MSDDTDPNAPPERFPAPFRAGALIHQVRDRARKSEVTALEMAGLRTANRENANFASQIIASSHLLAAALREYPDREAALLAASALVNEHMEELDLRLRPAAGSA